MVYRESLLSTRKTPTALVREKAMRSKKFEAAEEKGRWKGRDVDGPAHEAPKCKCYLTQGGCKKGRVCRLSHDQKDD